MKKLFLATAALLAMSACSKEENIDKPSAELPMLKAAVNPNDYEIYEYPENYDEVLEDYLDLIENQESVGDQSIQEAIWTIESGLNYVYGNGITEFKGTTKETLSYEFDLGTGSVVDGQDITNTFLNAYGIAEGLISSSQEFLTADVIVSDLTGTALTLEVQLVFAIDAQAVAVVGGIYGGLPAVDERQAGTNVKCGNSTGTGTEPTYQYNADQTMKGYNRGFAFKWGGGNKYFTMNVRSFSSQNTNNLLTSDDLFGNSSSDVPAYTGFSSPTACLSESEQDVYINVMWNDLRNLAFRARYKVLSISMSTATYPLPPYGILWFYQDVKVGEFSAVVNQNFVFSPHFL